MSILSRLYMHPVKSMRGLQLSHALAGADWLAFDRVFMLTDAGRRLYHRPDRQSRHVRFADFSVPVQSVEVWGNHFTAYPALETINTWLSGYLKQPVTLC